MRDGDRDRHHLGVMVCSVPTARYLTLPENDRGVWKGDEAKSEYRSTGVGLLRMRLFCRWSTPNKEAARGGTGPLCGNRSRAL